MLSNVSRYRATSDPSGSRSLRYTAAHERMRCLELADSCGKQAVYRAHHRDISVQEPYDRLLTGLGHYHGWMRFGHTPHHGSVR